MEIFLTPFNDTWNGKILINKIKEQVGENYQDAFVLKIRRPEKFRGQTIKWSDSLRNFGLEGGQLKMAPRIQYALKIDKETEFGILKKTFKSEYKKELKKDVNFVKRNEIFLLNDNDKIKDINELVVVNRADGPIVTLHYKHPPKNSKIEAPKAHFKDNWTLSDVLREIRASPRNPIPANIKDADIEFWTDSDLYSDLTVKVGALELDNKTIYIERKGNVDQVKFQVNDTSVDIGYSSKWNVKRLKKEIRQNFGPKFEMLKNDFILVVEETKELLVDDTVLENIKDLDDVTLVVYPAHPVSLEFKFLGRKYEKLEDICNQLRIILLDGGYRAEHLQDEDVVQIPQNQKKELNLVCVPRVVVDQDHKEIF